MRRIALVVIPVILVLVVVGARTGDAASGPTVAQFNALQRQSAALAAQSAQLQRQVDALTARLNAPARVAAPNVGIEGRVSELESRASALDRQVGQVDQFGRDTRDLLASCMNSVRVNWKGTFTPYC